jgi:uncharacterized protein (DUF1800 family)
MDHSDTGSTDFSQPGASALAALAAGALLAGCGAGADSGGTGTVTAGMSGSAASTATGDAPSDLADVALTTGITDAAAARFLIQASLGATRSDMARVRALGYAAWIEEQCALPQSTSRWDALVAGGYTLIDYRNSQAGFDACAWRKLITAPDTLRQRVTLALAEIIVVGIDGLIGAGWKQFTAAAWLDMLESYAFGNYRDLLLAVSTSTAMGEYLTFRGNVKYNPRTGALPDENYARELMQLFSIGLVQLNLDGTPKLVNGAPVETYTLDDITGLARVFTGWDYDMAGGNATTPDFKRRPMKQVATRHETGSKTFLGATIAAGGDGASDVQQAIDIIFNHPNVAPFVSRQLIQRLVTSNPTPAYVGRVAAVFSNDGHGVRGNLKAVVKAILMDAEARSGIVAAGAGFGKQREPMLRFLAWARAFNANSPSNLWAIGNTTDAARRLGQSPLRSPSVFNFFRPGYVPPNSGIAAAGLVAPEFQLTNESSTVGYINYMQTAVSHGVGDVTADYSTLLPLADNAAALVDELNTVLVAGQLQAATVALIASAVGSQPAGTDSARRNRIYAALTLVLASPEFIIQK